jgi:ABC-type glycerol-3-phosphate transport system substrate-binding protein
VAPALKSGRLALLGALALGIAPAGAQSLDELYQKAKAEGAFTLYVGGPSAPWEARARTFEERYPGIKISITGGFSNVLDKKIDQQLSAGKLEVDAAIFQTLNDSAGRRKAICWLTSPPASRQSMQASRIPMVHFTASR